MYIHEGAGGGGEVSSAHEAGKLLRDLTHNPVSDCNQRDLKNRGDVFG